MADHQEKLSGEIKVRNDAGVVTIEHSAAYDAQMERFYAGERFTAEEKSANQKLIDAEEAQMEAARRDPAGFIKLQEARMRGEEVNLTATGPAAEIEAPAQDLAAQQHASAPDKKLTVAERVDLARQAFEEASPEDRAVALKNLEGVQDVLAKAPNMTHELLVLAQVKAFVDEGEKLHERNIATYQKENALTWEVANYSQAPGKTLVNADAGVDVKTGDQAYGVSASHGIDAKTVGLDLAQVNGGAGVDSKGATNASLGVKAVKQIYEDGGHHVFLAGAADTAASGLETDPKLSSTATGLVVNTHQLDGRPISEIVGAVVDLQTGNATAVGSVSTTFNADTGYATTARAIGTYGIESGDGGFSLEAYQKTGINKMLTARLSAGVNDVGGTNDISVGAGVSLGF